MLTVMLTGAASANRLELGQSNGKDETSPGGQSVSCRSSSKIDCEDPVLQKENPYW